MGSFDIQTRIRAMNLNGANMNLRFKAPNVRKRCNYI